MTDLLGDQERVTEIEERAVKASDLLPLEPIEYDPTEDALHFAIEEDIPWLIGKLLDARAELATVKQQCSDNLREITARDAEIAELREYAIGKGAHYFEEAERLSEELVAREAVIAEVASMTGSTGHPEADLDRIAMFLANAAPVSVLASHDAEVAAEALEEAASKADAYGRPNGDILRRHADTYRKGAEQ